MNVNVSTVVLRHRVRGGNQFTKNFIFLVDFCGILRVQYVTSVVTRVKSVPMVFRGVRVIGSGREVRFVPIPSTNLVQVLYVNHVSWKFRVAYWEQYPTLSMLLVQGASIQGRYRHVTYRGFGFQVHDVSPAREYLSVSHSHIFLPLLRPIRGQRMVLVNFWQSRRFWVQGYLVRSSGSIKRVLYINFYYFDFMFHRHLFYFVHVMSYQALRYRVNGVRNGNRHRTVCFYRVYQYRRGQVRVVFYLGQFLLRNVSGYARCRSRRCSAPRPCFPKGAQTFFGGANRRGWYGGGGYGGRRTPIQYGVVISDRANYYSDQGRVPQGGQYKARFRRVVVNGSGHRDGSMRRSKHGTRSSNRGVWRPSSRLGRGGVGGLYSRARFHGQVIFVALRRMGDGRQGRNVPGRPCTLLFPPFYPFLYIIFLPFYLLTYSYLLRIPWRGGRCNSFRSFRFRHFSCSFV